MFKVAKSFFNNPLGTFYRQLCNYSWGEVMEINMIYITTGSKDEARMIGKTLVSNRLAACVNIIENMNSIYMWDGKLQDDKETILIAKTTKARVPDLIEKVNALHSYDCPCIVSLPVADGNPAFLKWVSDEVQ
jgi:periplasmic divalent cation tolerance protein